MEESIKKLWEKSHIFKVEHDKLKKKKVIYNGPILANQLGFQNACVLPFFIQDAYSRYYRMNDINVLSSTIVNNLAKSSFVLVKKKNNKLDNSLVEQYYQELDKLGVCYDKKKSFDLNSDTSIHFIQQFFLELYERGYIKNTNELLYTNNDKYFQDFEVLDELSYEQKIHKVFSIDISNIKDKIIDKIKALPLKEEQINNVLKIFAPYEIYDVNFNTLTGADLKVQMTDLVYIGGISFIIINPNLMEFRKFVTADEKDSIENTLLDGNLAFSGNFAINPLTGKQIPIFLSDKIESKTYVGIPDINLNDYELAMKEEFSYLPIVEEGYIINSDFLSGMTVESAKIAIENSFLSEGLASISLGYKANKIIISSRDEYGCLIPMLQDEDTLYPLKDNLPITFTSKFRHNIPNSDEIEAIGNIVTGSLNKYFVGGLAPIANILFNEFIGIINPFTKDGINDLKDFNIFEQYIIDSNRLISDLVMPLVFYTIIEEEMKVNLNIRINNIVITNSPLDLDGKEYLPQNLNLIDFEKVIDRYSPDAVRLYYFSCDKNDILYFDEDSISYYQNIVYSIRRTFNTPFKKEAYSLEMALYEFDNKMNKDFINGDFKLCYENIIELQKKYLQNPDWTKKQAFIFLKWINLFLPFLAEEVFKDVFGSDYSILEENFK